MKLQLKHSTSVPNTYTLDAEGSLQIILPTQNLGRAYCFDKESEAVL